MGYLKIAIYVLITMSKRSLIIRIIAFLNEKIMRPAFDFRIVGSDIEYKSKILSLV